jgi:hypothetical protein
MKTAIKFVVIVFAVIAAYIGSYYVLVTPGGGFHSHPVNQKDYGKTVTFTVAEGEQGSSILTRLHLGLGFYEPIHRLDRYLFPSRWYSQVTRTEPFPK